MQHLPLDTRYARALFQQARQQGALERVGQDLKLLAGVAQPSGLLALLCNPTVRAAQKRGLLNKVLAPHLHGLTLSLLLLLLRKRRSGELLPICAAFQKAYREQQGITRVYLTTAQQPSTALQQRLKAWVARLTPRPHVELHSTTDPALIGGFVLRMGGRQVDASLRTQLRKLQQLWLAPAAQRPAS